MHIFATSPNIQAGAGQGKAAEGGKGGGGAGAGADINARNKAVPMSGQGLVKPNPEYEPN